MDMSCVFDAAAPEIDVEEASGVLELPITGWVVHPRKDSVRLVGYISRDNDRREPTVILHVPTKGFVLSMARMIARWQRTTDRVH